MRMPRAGSIATPLLLTSALLTNGLRAQEATDNRSAREIEKESLRWVRLLELEDRRQEAWSKIMVLRAPAVRHLARMLEDPRPDVADHAARMLADLGEDASDAIPTLDRLARTREGAVQRRCRWALGHVQLAGTLLTAYGANEVVMIDDEGKVLQKWGDLKGPWDGEPTGGGGIVASEYSAGTIKVLDDKNALARTLKDVGSPYDVDLLPNGHILVADSGKTRVVEFDLDGKVVWEIKKVGHVVDVNRLFNGHTLIADSNGKVVEYDRDKKVVWQMTGLEHPMDADRLPNGNTLIALYGGNAVIEVQPDKTEVLRIAVDNAQDADLLPDGRIAVAATSHWYVFDRKGHKRWTRKGNYASDITWR